MTFKKDGSAIAYLNTWCDLVDSAELSIQLCNHFSYLAAGRTAQQQLKRICEQAVKADITGKEELQPDWDIKAEHIFVVYFSRNKSEEKLLVAFPPCKTSKTALPDSMKRLWAKHNGLFFIDSNMNDPIYRICPITRKGMYSNFDFDDAGYNPNNWLCVGEDQTHALTEFETIDVLGNWFIRKLHLYLF